MLLFQSGAVGTSVNTLTKFVKDRRLLFQASILTIILKVPGYRKVCRMGTRGEGV